jgi:copper chaperone CopZ
MTKLHITGMNCQHCAQAVDEALAEVAGVDGVEVSLERGQAQVAGDADVESLIAAVAEEGYQARMA